MKEILFIGNYSLNGINVLSFDESDGITEISQMGGILQINSYIHKYNNYLYTIVEKQEDEIIGKGYVEAYRTQNGELNFINQKLSYGEGPCFVIVDEYREILYVCNYTDGSFVAFKVEENGSIGEKLYYKRFNKTSKIHHIQFSKDYNMMYVIDLGDGKLYAFEIRYKDNVLELKNKAIFRFSKHVMPRHMAIDKENNIYVITEVSCEIYKIRYDNKGKLLLLDKKSILPKGLQRRKEDTGATIKIDSDNEYLYASIRGHNSISVFDIRDNRLNLIQNIKCGGDSPRDINLDKSEKYLFCANLNSNSISIFHIYNGLLEYRNKVILEKPSCIVADWD